jgi:hypothetical protein
VRALRVNLRRTNGFAAQNDAENDPKLLDLVWISRRGPPLPQGSNSAIGHWHSAVLQLFLLVNQEIDQWRAAP